MEVNLATELAHIFGVNEILASFPPPFRAPNEGRICEYSYYVWKQNAYFPIAFIAVLF